MIMNPLQLMEIAPFELNDFVSNNEWLEFIDNDGYNSLNCGYLMDGTS